MMQNDKETVYIYHIYTGTISVKPNVCESEAKLKIIREHVEKDLHCGGKCHIFLSRHVFVNTLLLPSLTCLMCFCPV